DPRVDRERYQTVYARTAGAAAAPTAGLHFTAALFKGLAARGVAVADVTLHVGEGTFAPLRTTVVEQHRMHAEVYQLPAAAAAAVRAARVRAGRVVAVGTTSCRTLETCALPDRTVRAGHGSTDLFLYPGKDFRVVDALLTNFHLPRSTLLMLVAAFAGREAILAVYRQAIAQGYRFYSYGDAMLIT
ncbi:MAG TPA: S-adenosylmethionine:tRNA ribosyltransferase-isomerase, partial [Planctomycetota bacterium]|nr:S-adenosylmethionine:tRNA ribosyltransferase-isomerase [Planctomycetota bacterium]